MDEQSVRGRTGMGQTAARGLVATALTLSLVPSLAYASPENEEEAPSATNTEEASSQSEVGTTSESDYTAVALSAQVGNASANYDLSKIADGTYEGKAVIGEDGLTIDGSDSGIDDGDSWEGYTVTVQVTVANHAITKVEVSSDAPRKSKSYVTDAINGYEDAGNTYVGIPTQIASNNGTSSVDAVSGATVTSKAIVAATNNALENAKKEETPVADEYTYGYAGLSWAEYWAAEGVYNASDTSSSSELDSHNEADKGGFDVVTRATANHGLHRGSYQCLATIYTNEGATFNLATWASDGKSFTTTDGKTVSWNRGAMTCDGTSYTLKDYEVTGVKYVPVKVRTADLDAFKEKYQFVANGENIAGGYGEGQLSSYSATAEVTANTNGLKTAVASNGGFTFSAEQQGSDSGIQGQDLKSADLSSMGPNLVSGDKLGSYGEFIRLDFTNGFGDLGSAMQAVTWTYYGNDSTFSTPLRSFGTKFAADNWMHKSMGIQLGLTDSARCQLPENTDGTGYWKVTIHALGYADSSYTFQATSENIKKEETPVTEETKQKLQALYDQAAALNKADYTAESWEKSAIETETAETKELLAKDNLAESEASEQITHLQGALDALVAEQKTTPQAGDYVLMNIPYSEFYAAETGNNNTSVDVFTSATKSKTKNTGLAGGSYHAKDDGSEITGITFPVKVTESAAGIDWSKYTKAENQEDLFGSASYAYSLLSEAPASYKELSVGSDGVLSFGKTEGAEAQVVDGSDGEFTTESNYGDYEIDFSTDSAAYKALDGSTIYGSVVNTTDGYGYGMRHLENIWKTGKHGFQLAWCTGFTGKVHNCPTSSAHYESMMGKTIKDITVYSSAGTFTITVGGENGVYVPIKSNDVSLAAQDASLDSENPMVAVEINLPNDFDAEYSVAGWDSVEFDKSQARSAVTKSLKVPAGTNPGSYTLVAKDKGGKYADVSTSFTLATANSVAKYDDSVRQIVAAQDGADISSYLENIKTVKVNGTEYAAVGRGSLRIVNPDGTVNLDASVKNKDGSETKVFDGYGSYQVEVVATGYSTNLTFEATKQADKTALNNAISKANALTEENYSQDSWSVLQKEVKAAQLIADQVDATDDAVEKATQAVTSAIDALAPNPRIALSEVVAGAKVLNQSDYTAASWAPFANALEAAQQVADDASDAQVNAAKEALVKAQANLEKAATQDDRTNLLVEIGRADVLDESDYTADSWKAYQEALSAAKDVSEKADASAEEAQLATADLAKARQALTAIGDDSSGAGDGSSDSGNGSDAGDPSDGADGSDSGTDGDSGNESSANVDEQSDASSSAPQTGDNLLAFGGVFAAIAAAAAGAAAWARRRVLRK